MKTIRLLLNLALFLAGMLVIIGCTSTPSVDDEPYYGTWVNEEHVEYGKYVQNPDGTCMFYTKPTDSEPAMECRYTFEEKWRDDEGNYYYRIIAKWSTGSYDESSAVDWYVISMIEPSGNMMVSTVSQGDYPEEIPTTQTMSMHKSYYRQNQIRDFLKM